MGMGCRFSTLCISGEDEAHDGRVFPPDHQALIGIVQNHAHGTLQMRPLGCDGFLDRGIAGQAVDGSMKIDIGLDEGGGRTIRSQRRSMLQSFFKVAVLLRADGTHSNALSGKPGGEGIQRCPDLIQVDNPPGIQRSHGKATLAAFRQQTLVLQQLKGVTDGLPRHAKPLSQFFLAYAAAGRQAAVGDGFHKPIIYLVNQNRLCEYGFHGSWLAVAFWNSEFVHPTSNWLRSSSPKPLYRRIIFHNINYTYLAALWKSSDG